MSKIPPRLRSHILNQRLRVDDQVLIKSYALSIELDDHISNENKQLLWMFILYSKDAGHGNEVEIGAANAITILNYARVSFSGMNLTNVYIRNANLSNAILDHTDLSGADLTGVDFRGAFLGGAILKLPDMTRVNLGESMVKLPFSVNCMCIVPDTDLIIIRKTAGWVYIVVYDFVRNTILTRIDNVGGGSRMVLSPNNKWLAFGAKITV